MTVRGALAKRRVKVEPRIQSGMPPQPPPPESRSIRFSLGPELTRVQWNHDRIESLMVIYDSIEDRRDQTDYNHRDDLLRTQVVFVHATLEDFLRSIGAICLPETTAERLDGIPLAGTRSAAETRRPEKFSLGDLAQHRFRTVYEIIDESVLAYVSQATFSGTAAIAAFLFRCGLEDQGGIALHYPAMEALIRRRHQIVHRADIPEGGDEPAPITKGQVLEWLTAARLLTAEIAKAHSRKWG